MKLFTPNIIVRRRPLGRFRTCDVAFPYRMGAGFPGDFNRVHPFTVEACLIDPLAPPTAYGQAVLVDAATQGVRPLVAGDQALTAIYGITCRPFPAQQFTGGMAAAIGAAAPPVSGVIDVLRMGYIMVLVNGVTGKGGTSYIWTAAAAGAHVQGGWEAVNPAGSGMNLTNPNTTFNGPPDASGVTELAFNI